MSSFTTDYGSAGFNPGENNEIYENGQSGSRSGGESSSENFQNSTGGQRLSSDVLLGEGFLPTTDEEQSSPERVQRNTRRLLHKKNRQQMNQIEEGVSRSSSYQNSDKDDDDDADDRHRHPNLHHTKSMTNLKEFLCCGNANPPLLFYSALFLIAILVAWVHSYQIAPVIIPGGSNDGTNDNSHSKNQLPYNDAKINEQNSYIPVKAKEVPFPTVHRSTYGTPASDIINPSFFSSDKFHPFLDKNNADLSNEGNAKDKINSPLLNVPIPTGAFWTNLVVEPTPDEGKSYPIMVYPFAYNWSPKNMIQASYPPLRRMTDAISIRDIFNADLSFSTKESMPDRHITNFDPLSVTLRFHDDQDKYWESYLVQGSPYITLKYQETTPNIIPLSIFTNFFCLRDSDGKFQDNPSVQEQQQNRQDFKQNDQSSFGVCEILSTPSARLPTKPTTLRGVQFMARTLENQTWIIFSSEPITLTLDNVSKRTIVSKEKFNGVLRLALIPSYTHGNEKKDDSIVSSTGLQRLIYHANNYPTRATLSWDFRQPQKQTSSKKTRGLNSKKNTGYMEKLLVDKHLNEAIVTFDYEVQYMRKNSIRNKNDNLLMLALPHHVSVLPKDSLISKDEFDISYKCIKGTMTPVIGSTWIYNEPLTEIGFESEASLEHIVSLDQNIKDKIMKQVKFDLTRVLPVKNENVYGYGKQVARLAQLAHIADLLTYVVPLGTDASENGTASQNSDIAKEATRLLHDYLSMFLKNEVDDYILYDFDFGGLVSVNGLRNHEEDFGNGWYNDHHFHYGYILYASAVMGRLNSTFVSEFGAAVDAFFYDVVHDDDGTNDGYFFPFTRHKSWFDGHSYASGLFPFANGKSMESSSESINCYYGAYLWSSVRGGDSIPMKKKKLINFTRLLLAMEIRGVKTYWHMMPQNITDDNNTYKSLLLQDEDFTKNYMVGNSGMMDVTITTWFGTKPLYVHMINFMPITSITREMFDIDYLKGEFKNMIEPIYNNVEMAWRGYTVCDKAMIEPSSAWVDALALRSYELDSGISQSQVLYFTSTSDGFVPPPNEVHEEKPDPATASCKANKECASLNLGGDCCPTPEGTLLGCCDKLLQHTCDHNERCASTGLSGLCCPTASGIYLGCCDTR
jgi:endoglucanase Acf2